MLGPLEACPPELVEQIVQHLPLPDAASLRLCSRRLAMLATQETFKHYFSSKKVRITEADLTRFVAMTGPGELGCLVENLYLTAVAIDTDFLERVSQEKTRSMVRSQYVFPPHRCTQLDLAVVEDDIRILNARRRCFALGRESGRHHELLAQALRNVAVNGRLGGLDLLYLDVAMLYEGAMEETRPGEGGNWKLIWEAASDCFDVATAALAASKIRVNEMDAFSSVHRCSLGIDKLMLHAGDLEASLLSLKSLSLSVSDQIFTDEELRTSTTEELDALAAHQDVIGGFPKLLRQAPKLESLHIHSFDPVQRLDHENSVTYLNYSYRIIVSLATVDLPYLRSLTIRGTEKVSVQTFLTILRNAPGLQKLSLENVRLAEESSFRPIFDHCTGSESKISDLFFDDLFERHRLVVFKGEGDGMKYLSMPPISGSPTLRRTGNAVGKPIQYGRPYINQIGSVELRLWREARKRDYGPAWGL